MPSKSYIPYRSSPRVHVPIRARPFSTTSVAGYVNPLGTGRFTAERTDQGVDYKPNDPGGAALPYLAIGNGVVTYSNMHAGWPGGGFIVYQLTDGPAQGQFIYYAEDIFQLAAKDTKLKAGDVVCMAYAGKQTEIGWAQDGTHDLPLSRYPPGAADGTPTEGGKAFARFLRALGATTQQDPGLGPLWIGAGAPTYDPSQPGGGNPNASPGLPTISPGIKAAWDAAAALASVDLPDPRDNLPFSPLFQGAWGVNAGGSKGTYTFDENGIVGQTMGYANMVRGGMTEIFSTDANGNAGPPRPNGQFKCFFMLNPDSIATQLDINMDSAVNPMDMNTQVLQASPYPFSNTTISFTLIFNRMYEVWRGDAGSGQTYGSGNNPNQAPGPSQIGVRWDIRALERLMGMYDGVGYAGNMGFGNLGAGPGIPISMPIQVVFGGPNSIQFGGIIVAMDYTYTRFSADMIPTEATVDIQVMRRYMPGTVSADLINALIPGAAAGAITTKTMSSPYAPYVASNFINNPGLSGRLDSGFKIITKPGQPV